jgi:hypothetical protein
MTTDVDMATPGDPIGIETLGVFAVSLAASFPRAVSSSAIAHPELLGEPR